MVKKKALIPDAYVLTESEQLSHSETDVLCVLYDHSKLKQGCPASRYMLLLPQGSQPTHSLTTFHWAVNADLSETEFASAFPANAAKTQRRQLVTADTVAMQQHRREEYRWAGNPWFRRQEKTLNSGWIPDTVHCVLNTKWNTRSQMSSSHIRHQFTCTVMIVKNVLMWNLPKSLKTC